MSDLIAWLLGLVKALFLAVWDFITDMVIAVLELFLNAVAALLTALPVPSFMSNGGMQGLFNNLPADVMYFAGRLHLGECFAILGAAVLFRLVRKALTLFQW